MLPIEEKTAARGPCASAFDMDNKTAGPGVTVLSNTTVTYSSQFEVLMANPVGSVVYESSWL